jgi:hypothetical protein
MAENVLEAGERNALDMLPVYQGVIQVLARRETVRPEEPLDFALPDDVAAEDMP